MLIDAILSNVDERVNPSARIKGLWIIDFSCSPSDEERAFSNYIVVAQSEYQGCCFTSERPRVEPSDLIGDSVDDHLSSSLPLTIALVDSLFPKERGVGEEKHVLTGPPPVKSKERAEIVADVASRVVGETVRERESLLIGFVKNIYLELQNRGFGVKATDFDQKVVDTEIRDSLVENGEKNPKYLREADVAVVTGMTLRTGTLESIIERCREYDTKLVVFAQTGSNLSYAYLEHGVDAVVREPFPIYDFHGRSEIYVNYP